MDFYPSQKVVCVCAGAIPGYPIHSGRWGDSDAPVEGKVYTVLSSHIHDNVHVLWLYEIQRSDLARKQYGPKVGYNALRFRPLDERKTDISVFQKMLATKKEDA